jgi:hypothetical protein
MPPGPSDYALSHPVILIVLFMKEEQKLAFTNQRSPSNIRANTQESLRYANTYFITFTLLKENKFR